MPNALAFIMAAFQFVVAVACACTGDMPKAAYWVLVAALTVVVTTL